MKHPLTIAFITARHKPQAQWFVDSLRRQMKVTDDVHVVIVSLHPIEVNFGGIDGKVVEPKPTVWQGKHRITKADWWAASSARNTGICYCDTPWIVFLDDRSVLMPGWLAAVNTAMTQGYGVCGAYEKVHNLVVEDGIAKSWTELPNNSGKDTRYTHIASMGGLNKGAIRCPGPWWFGCSSALPVEWALSVNGWDETCDGMSMEDVIFGLMLENNRYPICYDPAMKMMEDRTPSECSDHTLRKDKGISPNDKSHAMLNMLRGRKTAAHELNLTQMRYDCLEGKSFPIPTGPVSDWYDGQAIKDFAP